MSKATTVRFTDEMFARLDQASSRTGMPVNSIVIAACLEWMQRHTPPAERRGDIPSFPAASVSPVAPRWATIRRAVELAVGSRAPLYPFERFSSGAQKLLTLAQGEAVKSGHAFIGTEHLLLASFGDSDFHSVKIFAALKIDQVAVRKDIEKVEGTHTPAPRTPFIPTSRVKAVIESAFLFCGARGDARVSTGHILLAMVAEGQGIAGQVLRDLGATTQRIEAELAQLSEPEA